MVRIELRWCKREEEEEEKKIISLSRPPIHVSVCIIVF
jgi:hypothetical protein